MSLLKLVKNGVGDESEADTENEISIYCGLKNISNAIEMTQVAVQIEIGAPATASVYKVQRTHVFYQYAAKRTGLVYRSTVYDQRLNQQKVSINEAPQVDLIKTL